MVKCQRYAEPQPQQFSPKRVGIWNMGIQNKLPRPALAGLSQLQALPHPPTHSILADTARYFLILLETAGYCLILVFLGFGPSEVHATSGATQVGHYFGPSEVRASVEQLRQTTIFGIFPPSSSFLTAVTKHRVLKFYMHFNSQKQKDWNGGKLAPEGAFFRFFWEIFKISETFI